MPGLQSFCVCTAVGLASIYLLQLSWFTAWLVLDERRILASRSGLLPCLRHQASHHHQIQHYKALLEAGIG